MGFWWDFDVCKANYCIINAQKINQLVTAIGYKENDYHPEFYEFIYL